MKTTVDIGRFGEKVAAKFLKRKELKIVAQNLHVSHNEIDIIAKDIKNRTIIFVEVKSRSVDEGLYSSYGTPASAVTRSKQKRTIEAARGYISESKNLLDYSVRFDVIEVYINKNNFEIIKINHIENAFCV